MEWNGVRFVLGFGEMGPRQLLYVYGVYLKLEVCFGAGYMAPKLHLFSRLVLFPYRITLVTKRSVSLA